MDNLKIELVEMGSKNIFSIREKINISQFGEHMGKIFKKMVDEKLEPLGAPLAIYHDEEFDPESADVEIGIPVREIREDTRDLPGGSFAKASIKGSYDNLGDVYKTLFGWIDKEGYRLNNSPYEVYVSDPNTTKAEDMIREVYFPVIKK